MYEIYRETSINVWLDNKQLDRSVTSATTASLSSAAEDICNTFVQYYSGHLPTHMHMHKKIIAYTLFVQSYF